jgi:hypothetical protein
MRLPNNCNLRSLEEMQAKLLQTEKLNEELKAEVAGMKRI